jgi:hypothetical protein
MSIVDIYNISKNRIISFSNGMPFATVSSEAFYMAYKAALKIKEQYRKINMSYTDAYRCTNSQITSNKKLVLKTSSFPLFV